MMGLVNGTKTEDDINAGIIRFADLLRIEAEANIEWDGGDLAIAEANINRVRARVNMPPVTDRSREGLRKALRYERKAELCNEGFRWFDIRPLEDRFQGGQRPDVRSGVFDGAESGKLHLQRQAFVR